MLLTSLDAPGVPAGALAWPGARAMFDNAFDLNLERRIKYLWRLALTWNVRGRLLREFDGHAMIEALFRAQPRAFYPVMNHLIDRRMSAKARLRTTLASLRVVCGSVGDDDNVRSLLTHGITLLELADHTRVVLSLNDVSFHEGLWQIGLVGADGIRLYSIGFGFTDAGTLLMGNVQGPSLKDDGLDRIRDATHAAHGMRPPHLLVHTLRVLAAALGRDAPAGRRSGEPRQGQVEPARLAPALRLPRLLGRARRRARRQRQLDAAAGHRAAPARGSADQAPRDVPPPLRDAGSAAAGRRHAGRRAPRRRAAAGRVARAGRSTPRTRRRWSRRWSPNGSAPSRARSPGSPRRSSSAAPR